MFKVVSPFTPQGDQPEAIEKLSEGVLRGDKLQVLLGVTGSGKTYTMAKVIEKVQKPTLVLAHNKTLAAQLCSELKGFFPDSAVEYFVSYYDYYQPEAYIASSDTYIEKTTAVNEEIDRLRHSATCALNERKDVIIVASVSCIYALGDPEEYLHLALSLRPGMEVSREEVMRKLVDIQFQRNDLDFQRGTFRVRGDTLDIFPMGNEGRAIRVSFFGDEIERITEINTLTGEVLSRQDHAIVFPASHYATGQAKLMAAMNEIERDMELRRDQFLDENKPLEAERIEQRVRHDMEMMQEIGYCNGIENYSRYFDSRAPGDPPYTLIDYFPQDFLLIIDESHVTIPQIGAMYRGDRMRKEELVKYGFRLPSAFDNRPLRFEEFLERIPQMLCVSATPGPWELSRCSQVAEQIIRPTGLVDPEIFLRPIEGQIDDILSEVRLTAKKGYRTLITTLTKRMAEDLTEYLDGMGVRVRYMHSDIDTLDRMEIIRDLRLGEFDVLVGINLLRRGGAGGHIGRGQGGIPAVRDLPHPDHRPGRPERGGPGAPLRGHRDPLHAAGHGRDRAPAEKADGLQRRARHHAPDHPQGGQRPVGHQPQGGGGRDRLFGAGEGRSDRDIEGADAAGGPGAGIRGGGQAPGRDQEAHGRGRHRLQGRPARHGGLRQEKPGKVQKVSLAPLIFSFRISIIAVRAKAHKGKKGEES